ncbi:MAG: hypothetical protein ABIJ21_02365 [Nanoarchaeota archaeon]
MNTTGYHPYPTSLARETFDELLANGVIHSGMTFLDLGAGRGNIAQIALEKGLEAFGIELDMKLIRDADPTRIARGSYYLPEYIQLREEGKTLAQTYEAGLPQYGVSQEKPFRFQAHNIFHPVIENQAYDQLGIPFFNFNIIFSYTWGIELPSQLEMFSLFANQHAIMLNANAQDPIRLENLLSETNLTMEVIKFREKQFPYYPHPSIRTVRKIPGPISALSVSQ